MASRINTRFVYLLAGSLALVTLVVVAVMSFGSFAKPDEALARARALVSQGKTAEAADAVGRLVHRFPNNRAVLLAYVDVLSQLPTKDFDTANQASDALRGASTQAVDLDPSDHASLERLMQLYMKFGRELGVSQYWDLMWQYTDRMLRNHPDNLVVRKYHGIAGVHRMSVIDVPSEDRTAIEADLRAALKADPGDIDALMQLAMWNAVSVHYAMLPPEHLAQAAAFRQKAQEYADQLTTQAADRPALREYDKAEVLRMLAANLSGPERSQALDAAGAALTKAEQVLLANPDDSMLVLEVVGDILAVNQAGMPATPTPETVVLGNRALQRAEVLIRAACSLHPDDMRSQMTLGKMLTQERNYDSALEAFDRAADLKAPSSPVDAMIAYTLKIEDQLLQATVMLNKVVDPATNPTQREALTQQATKLVEYLKTQRPNAPEISLLEGKLAAIKGQWVQATQLLDAACAQWGDRNPDALLASARARERLGELGAADERLQSLIKLAPDFLPAHYERAVILLQLRNYEGALEQIDVVTKAQPNNRGALALKAQLAGEAHFCDAALTIYDQLDPQHKDRQMNLARAEALRLAGRFPEAQKAAEPVFLADPKDLGVLQALLSVTLDKSQVAAFIARARQAGADKSGLDLLDKVSKNQESSGQFLLDMAARQTDPLTRGLADVRAYKRLGRQADAAKALAQLVKDFPDNSSVVVAQFEDAVDRRDFTLAEALAVRGQQLNVDQANGNFLMGTLAMARGQTDRAITYLTQGVKLRPVHSEGWRALGDAQVLANDPQASASYTKALELRPNNMAALRSLVRVYDARDDYFDALTWLRKGVEFAPDDRSFREFYLSYEEEHGNAEKYCLPMRRQLLITDPTDDLNQRELARLLCRLSLKAASRGDARKLQDEARGMIDKLIQEQGRTAPNLDALAYLIDLQGDHPGAQALLRNYVLGLGAKATAGDWLPLARYLAANGDDAGADDAYQHAMALEDKVERPVTRELADLEFDRGQWGKAATLYHSVYDANTSDLRIAQRYAEALIRDHQIDQANTVLRALVATHGEDSNSCVLKALIAGMQGRYDQAENLLNQAVNLSPNRPVVYFERAVHFAEKPDHISAAMDDLKKAIDLDPRAVRPRMVMAQLDLRIGDHPAAMDQLKNVLKFSPHAIPARILAAQIMLNTDQRDALSAFLDECTSMFPNETLWWRVRAQLQQRSNHLDDAVASLRKAVAINPSLENLGQLAQMLLTDGKAQEALDVMDPHAAALGKLPQGLSLRCRALAALKRDPPAHEALAQAIALCENFDQVDIVGQDVSAQLGPQKTAEWLRPLASGKQATWVQLDVALLQANGDQLQPALQTLDALANNLAPASPEASVRNRVLALVYTRKGQFQDARQLYEHLLQADANDVGALNNLAYILAEHLSDVHQAQIYAQRAVDLAPTDPRVLDTFGWVQYRSQNFDDAKRYLSRSLSMGRTAAAVYHMAVLSYEHEGIGPDRARQQLQEARQLAEQNKDTDSEFLRAADDYLKKLTKAP